MWPPAGKRSSPPKVNVPKASKVCYPCRSIIQERFGGNISSAVLSAREVASNLTKRDSCNYFFTKKIVKLLLVNIYSQCRHSRIAKFSWLRTALTKKLRSQRTNEQWSSRSRIISYRHASLYPGSTWCTLKARLAAKIYIDLVLLQTQQIWISFSILGRRRSNRSGHGS